ncbi:MBL fold metallo-hydrolase [Nocardioides sp.]|uniref:MBL fold metallo-hydrolase RNA specificity domain-containing protein n=1 Tax=Nocardioides sp. TaxID=35761 RepID=UPI0019C2EB40|nr:MBL fold metallo-hydrolase [Nocardioides sp.]MBC7277712.1 MBL fold metallo-hydrolase [Nocardioides sp.]
MAHSEIPVVGDPGVSRSKHPALEFLGASGTVTGSRFLVTYGSDRLLVDAGLYQGLRELRRLNWAPFPVTPADLDAVVLTHAHLDHTGYLPRLVSDGFAGETVCTPGTAALTAIVLRDSAHLQEEDARVANEGGWSKHDPALPLYTAADVERTLQRLHPVAFGEPWPLGGMVVTLQRAGHILGSAVAVVDVGGERVVFSGDLGRPGHPILRPPAPPPAASAMVLESTYGDRRHPPVDPEVLADTVRRTVARGGVVLIPAFAVDRTELVLLELLRLRRTGLIPEVPIFVDSPMALASLDVYRTALSSHSDELDLERAAPLRDLDRLDVHRVRDAAGSERLNRPKGPCIIISASGMATGGRVVHHLLRQLPDPRNSIVLTGYQAQGTRGRQLVEGARAVKMHGRYVPVRAEVVATSDFSVHADADELVEWVASAPELPQTVYVVHGEPTSSRALADRIQDELGVVAVVPRRGERVLLGS